MEISLLKVLISNISSFLRLSSDDTKNHEPAHKYYLIIEEILMLLKPVLNAAFDAEIATSVPLQKAFKELSFSVDELRDLFGNWHPLSSKIYFVLEVETFIAKVRVSGIEILEHLKSSDQGLAIEFDASAIQKIDHIGLEQISVIVNEAIRGLEDGSGPSAETVANFANCLCLKLNQDLLIEAVALEKLKDNAEQAENVSESEYYDQLITIVTQMHEQLVSLKLSESSSPIPIPADFCCPLSLELMTDPVIVASGQTYERVFIRNWIDLGLTVCPKTRQTLSPTNLIPNYNVKALIVGWCEINNVKLPDNFPIPPVSIQSNEPTIMSSVSSSQAQQRTLSPSHSRSSSQSSLYDITLNGNVDAVDHQIPESPLRDEHVSSQATAYNSDTLREQTSESQAALNSTVPHGEDEFPTRLQIRSRNQAMFRRPIPRIVSSSAAQTRAVLLEVEAQIRNLVENLQSTSLDEQRVATYEIRQLAKLNMDNRIAIASCGAISFLVSLLFSTDLEIQENAVTALLNLSINDNNKAAIADAGAIEPLIHVLKTGTPEAKGNSAATLFSLSVVEDNKARIGRSSGAIEALVDLLGNGTPRGKKDASTALFNLSILPENKARIVEAGAVRYLVELMDPAAGMVDKAVAVLSNLSTIQEGKCAIGEEGGIPILVDVLELGSSRSKENAAAALLQLCKNSNRYSNMVIQEGAVPPLVVLWHSGTPRAKEKAQALVSHLRSQRHNNGRS